VFGRTRESNRDPVVRRAVTAALAGVTLISCGGGEQRVQPTVEPTAATATSVAAPRPTGSTLAAKGTVASCTEIDAVDVARRHGFDPAEVNVLSDPAGSDGVTGDVCRTRGLDMEWWVLTFPDAATAGGHVSSRRGSQNLHIHPPTWIDDIPGGWIGQSDTYSSCMAYIAAGATVYRVEHRGVADQPDCRASGHRQALEDILSRLRDGTPATTFTPPGTGGSWLSTDTRVFLDGFVGTWQRSDPAAAKYLTPAASAEFTEDASRWARAELNYDELCVAGSSGAGGCTFTVTDDSGESAEFLINYSTQDTAGTMLIDTVVSL